MPKSRDGPPPRLVVPQARLTCLAPQRLRLPPDLPVLRPPIPPRDEEHCRPNCTIQQHRSTEDSYYARVGLLESSTSSKRSLDVSYARIYALADGGSQVWGICRRRRRSQLPEPSLSNSALADGQPPSTSPPCREAAFNRRCGPDPGWSRHWRGELADPRDGPADLRNELTTVMRRR